MATTVTSKNSVAAVCLYSDDSIAYTHKLCASTTHWHWAKVLPHHVKVRAISLVATASGDLVVTVAYTDGALAFATAEVHFNWHFVAIPR